MRIIKDKYTYEESFWSGRNCLLINETECKRIDHNHFSYVDEDGNEKNIVLKGNLLSGLILKDDGIKVQINKKIQFYEFFLSFIFLILVFYNPIVGSIAGGIFGVSNFVIIRQFNNPIYKILTTILIGLLALFIVWLIVLLFNIK